MKKRSRTIIIIGIWMILATLPGMLPYIQYGIQESLMFVAVVEWICYLAAISCAIGLFFAKEWARRMAVWLFAIYFAWSLFVVYSLAGPSFDVLIEVQSKAVNLMPDVGEKLVVALLIANLVWPIIVVLFLTHPRVKLIFDPKFDPAEEQEELGRKRP